MINRIIKDTEQIAPLSITTANTGLSVLFVSLYFPQARSTNQIRNAIIAECVGSIKEMGSQYEDLHVHITFVARVVVKKIAFHPPIENT